MQNSNQRLLLKARPEGIAGPEHFEEDTQPIRQPGPGELLVESVYISIDPAMRVWVSENPGYVPPVEIGSVMRAGGIGRVLVSEDPNFQPGDFVNARLGWQTHPTVKAAECQKLDLSVGSPKDWIGPLGTTALTAYFGLFDVGAAQPGETVLVSAAAGGVRPDGGADGQDPRQPRRRHRGRAGEMRLSARHARPRRDHRLQGRRTGRCLQDRHARWL